MECFSLTVLTGLKSQTLKWSNGHFMMNELFSLMGNCFRFLLLNSKTFHNDHCLFQKFCSERNVFRVLSVLCVLTYISCRSNGHTTLYCCFVDFKKAFHSIDRTRLWKKFVYLGVTGKCLRIIYSLYSSI